jgi:hypothetical protein
MEQATMARNGSFNPAVRAREKQQARERDERLIASGQVSRQELARQNGFFSALDRSKVRIVRRRAAASER